MHTEVKKHLLPLKEYHLMYEKGILTASDQVELIHGEIFNMSSIGSRHATIVKGTNHHLHQKLGEKIVRSIRDPI
jgi:hypothetical protein